jgi:carboxyl-terminal processing protease
MTNEFSGIGIEITNEKGIPTVKSLLPGTPAYKSGLDAGDVITKVDGVSTRDMSLNCVVKNITGPEGTDVELTIRHKNEKKTQDIIITRAKITVPTIRGWKRTQEGDWKYFIDPNDKIGYIRLTSFSENSAKEFEKVLNKLEEEGMRGLILDLRYNSGGLLEIAADIADMFLKDGLIVSTRPRFGVLTYLSAEKKGTHPNYPLVVLTNKYSASASEIVAGALADKKHERAVLVGARTHGKGSVQGVTRHPGGGAKLKYTMAYYHLPSGQRVESRDAVKEQGRSDWGVAPDIKVELTDDEVKEMMDIRRANDVLVKEDHQDEKNPVDKYSLQKVFESDPQLAVGKLIVETQLYEKNILNRN